MKNAVRAGALLAVIVTAAACGSDSGGGTSSTQAGSSASPQQLSAVAAAVEADSAVPSWTAPGPALDGSKLRGKSIYVIPITSQSPFEIQVEETEKEIAAKMGIELTFHTNQGTVAEWVQGMNSAIAAKPDLIFLQSAPDPRQLQPQIAAANAAGIPVVASHIWDAKDPQAPDCIGCTGLAAVVKGPFSDAGRMMADWVINDSKGTANVLMVGIKGINSGDVVNAAEQAEYAANCPGCKVTTVSLTLDQISGGSLQAVSSALSADPGIDYIVPTFDILVDGTIASMNTSNRADGVKVVSFGGTSSVMAQVANPDSVVAADVAEPLAWTAYANLDQAFRIILGMPPVEAATPARVFDKTTISNAGAAPAYADGFGTEFADGYWKLWGLAG
ncbi:sugar ABC transporter substrate-binding protein [Nakamurella alba]|nr:substrate-binding domain-containing protein [Nakamurella alba]